MASDFNIFIADPVKDVGQPILIVADIRPAGTTVVRVEWYLFILSHTDALGDFDGQVFNLNTATAKEVDPVGTALGEAKNAFMRYQIAVMEKTGKPDNPTEIDLVDAKGKPFHRMWSYGVGHDEIKTIIHKTKCIPLNEYLLNVTATPILKRNTESPYPDNPKPDPELRS